MLSRIGKFILTEREAVIEGYSKKMKNGDLIFFTGKTFSFERRKFLDIDR